MSDERKEHPLEIIADMLRGVIPPHRRDEELLRHYADRFGAAWEHQRAEWEAKTLRELAIARDEMKEEYRKIYGGNVTKLREALLYVRNVLELNGFYEPAKRCDDALSAPQRNCDVGTAEEQDARFDKYCSRRQFCTGCPVKDAWPEKPRSCGVIWAQLPYKEGGAS